MTVDQAFGDGVFAAILSLETMLVGPLVYYLATNPKRRDDLPKWLVAAATMVATILSIYLATAVDYRLHSNQWRLDFIAAVALCSTLASRSIYRWGYRSEHDGGSEAEDVGTTSVTRSSAEYATLIISFEREAVSVDRMVKRISAAFKTPEEVKSIAEQRFGPGGSAIQPYLDEHRERHRTFVERLQTNSMTCREIYNLTELRDYLKHGHHGADVAIAPNHLRATALEWLRALDTYPQYFVGLTNELIPIKYQLFNGSAVIVHETAGKLDSQRLNSIIIRDPKAVEGIRVDFARVWERIPYEMRDKKRVSAFIRDELLPLIPSGEGEADPPARKGKRRASGLGK